MKKLLLLFALLICSASYYNTAEAQNVNININIGHQPAWGPVGYDYVEFYYFPAINCYYDVNLGMFYYQSSRRWISSRYLPYGYHKHDLYRLHKVAMNQPNPWLYNKAHAKDYKKYKGHSNQVVIRDSRDIRYRDSRNNNRVWYSDNRNAKNSRSNNQKDNKSSRISSSEKRDKDVASKNDKSGRGRNRNR